MQEEAYYSPTDVLVHLTLTPEREAELFRQFYAGDLEARDILIKNNLRYAASLALRHAVRRKYHRELISAANFGLVKAVESRQFDPAQGRFTTFATKYILGEIRAVFLVSCAVRFPKNYNLPDWPDETQVEAPVEDMDTLTHPAPFSPDECDYESVRAAMAKLAPKERQLIELIFFEGMNLSKAAEAMGSSRQWAHGLRDRAFANLRKGMEQAELPEAA